MLNLFLAVIASLALSTIGGGVPRSLVSEHLTVDLGYAKYQGFVDPVSNNINFLGVRFAAPPTGAARWTAPRTPNRIPAVQQAQTESATCIQAGAGVSPTSPFRTRAVTPSQSEDCLFLNVYVPAALGQSNQKVPVVVWIHGGGYMAGSAAQFNGNDLIREGDNGVVVVIVQYRLGLFGFLSGKEVNQGGVLNAGLLDQRFALQWVQQHIAQFNGDPQRVTIWGESAGGGSVMQHVIADGGQTRPSLFQKAITSSLYVPPQYDFNSRIPEALFSEVVSQAGCGKARNALSCLRSTNSSVLTSINTNIAGSVFFGTFAFVPVVDGSFIRERPTLALQQKKTNGNLLLSVTNTFEGNIFVDQSTAATVQIPNFVEQLFPTVSARQAQEAAAQYAGLGTNIFQANAVMGESIFICPTYIMLRAFQGRSFKAEFAIPPGTHGSDVAYYFPTGSPGNVPPFANPVFDAAFSGSFLNLAMTGNPNPKVDPANIVPSWPIFNNVEMLFNKTDAGGPVVETITTSSALLKRCQFWESIGAAAGQ